MIERETSEHGIEERIQDEARQLAESAREYGRAGVDGARRIGSNAAAFVSENALPLSLIGLGVGWLVLSMRKQDTFGEPRPYHGYDYYGQDEFPNGPRGALSRARDATHQLADRTRGASHQVADAGQQLVERTRDAGHQLVERTRETTHQLVSRVTDGLDSARSRAGELAAGVGHRASEWSHDARTQLNGASQRTVEYADENPLVVGAIAIAAGVGVGLALPHTQHEDQLLGGTRDRLLDDARGLIGEARASAEEATRELSRQARETKQELRAAVKEPRFSH